MTRQRKVHQPRSRRRRLALGAGLVAVALAVPTGTSYAAALAAPGAGPWDVASVTWLADHGLGPAVNLVETLVYSFGAPAATGAVPAGNLPSGAAPGGASGGAAAGWPPAIALPVPGPALPGEGQWIPAGQPVDGAPAAWTTFFRSDAAHTGVLTGVMLIDQSRTVTALVPGLTEPGGVAGAMPSRVPADLRGSLVGIFNAGYRFRDSPGGFYLGGHTKQPLRAGRASLVIGTDGHVDIRAWAGGPRPHPDVAAVRQNLALVVRDGRPVAGLAGNRNGAWGAFGQQNQFTVRTGAGITESGDLVVVEGGDMTLPTLATTLVEAGAVTAMQLDIHDKQVSAATFLPDPTSPTGVRATALLPDQRRPADRYLSPDQRDFVAVFTRGALGPGGRR